MEQAYLTVAALVSKSFTTKNEMCNNTWGSCSRWRYWLYMVNDTDYNTMYEYNFEEMHICKTCMKFLHFLDKWFICYTRTLGLAFMYLTLLLFDYSLKTWENWDMQRCVILLSWYTEMSSLARKCTWPFPGLPYQGDCFFLIQSSAVLVIKQ